MLINGEVVDSRYTVLEVLGQGSMGEVYKVEDIFGTICTLKRLAPVQPDPKDGERFKREAITLNQLDHANLPKVDNYFDDNGNYYLVMNFIDGRNLMDLLAQNPNGFSEKQIKEWLTTILDILNYLHSRNPPIIFRDIKPANLVLDKNGKLWLVDFGIAVFKQTASTPIITLGPNAQTGNFATAEFAAPEQDTQADEKTDIFNLGITMIQLLCGKSNLRRNFKLPLPNIKGLCQNISDEFACILDKMTKYYPDDRYNNVQEILVELLPNKPTDKTINLAHLPQIDSQYLKNNFPTTGYDLSFQQFITGNLEQLINYLENALNEQALRKIDILLDRFYKYSENQIFEYNNITRAISCIQMLYYCKIRLLLTTAPAKVENTIKNGFDPYSGDAPTCNESYLLAEYYESLGSLNKAKTVYQQITDNFPSETIAYQAIKKIELLPSQRRKQKIAQMQQKKQWVQQERQRIAIRTKQQLVNFYNTQLHPKNLANFATSNVSISILLLSILGAITIAIFIQNQIMTINIPLMSIIWFNVGLLLFWFGFLGFRYFLKRQIGAWATFFALLTLMGGSSFILKSYSDFKIPECQWSAQAQDQITLMTSNNIDDWRAWQRYQQIILVRHQSINTPKTHSPTQTSIPFVNFRNSSFSPKVSPTPNPAHTPTPTSDVGVGNSSPLYIPLKTISPTPTRATPTIKTSIPSPAAVSSNYITIRDTIFIILLISMAVTLCVQIIKWIAGLLL